MFNQIFGFLESFLVAFWPRVLFLQISKIFLSSRKLSFSCFGSNDVLFTTSVLIANLWSCVQNLTDPTEQGLLDKIAQQRSAWNDESAAIYLQRAAVLQQEAFNVSDPVSPQYLYQSGCGRTM